MAETAREVLEKTKSIMSEEGITQQRTKGTVGAAFIGAATGFMIGYSRKYNLGSSALLGALAAMLLAQLLLPKK